MKKNTTTIKIDNNALFQLLKGWKNNYLATIVTLTNARLKKTGNDGSTNPYYKEILKLSRFQVNVGFHYVNSVANQSIREGKEFERESVKQRVWGQRIKGSPLVEHNGQHYLEAKREKELSTIYFVVGSRQVLPKNFVDNFTTPKKVSSTQAHLNKPVVLNDIRLANVLSFATFGAVYKKPEAEEYLTLFETFSK